MPSKYFAKSWSVVRVNANLIFRDAADKILMRAGRAN